MFESVRGLFRKSPRKPKPFDFEVVASLGAVATAETLTQLRVENASLRTELQRTRVELDTVVQSHHSQTQHIQAQEERIRELSAHLQPDPSVNHFGITGRGYKHHNHQGICG